MEGEAEAAYAHGVDFPLSEALRTSKTGNQCQRSHGQQSQWHEVSERVHYPALVGVGMKHRNCPTVHGLGPQ